MTSLTRQAPEGTRRPRRLRIAGRSVVILLAVAAIVWAGFTSVYDPFAPGSSSGPRSESMRPVTDGISRTGWIVTGPTGGTGIMTWSIHNAGPLPVTLLDDGYEDEDEEGGLVEVRWGPLSSPRDNLFGGHPDEVRPLPVTIPADAELALWVTVTRPRCHPDGDVYPITSIPLRWSVLGRERLYEWPLADPESNTLPIHLCYPDEALRHLETW